MDADEEQAPPTTDAGSVMVVCSFALTALSLRDTPGLNRWFLEQFIVTAAAACSGWPGGFAVERVKPAPFELLPPQERTGQARTGHRHHSSAIRTINANCRSRVHTGECPNKSRKGSFNTPFQQRRSIPSVVFAVCGPQGKGWLAKRDIHNRVGTADIKHDTRRVPGKGQGIEINTVQTFLSAKYIHGRQFRGDQKWT